MGVMAVANPQMGVLCIDGNAIFSLNRKHTQKLYLSSSGFRINLRMRQPAAAISAFVGRESGFAEVIEKDFEFKPSFDEYLKAMESVQTGRGSNHQHSSTGSRPNPTTRSLKVEGDKGNLRVFEESISGETSILVKQVRYNKKNSNGVNPRERVAGGGISFSEKGNRNLKDARKVGFRERAISGSALDSKQGEMVMRVRRKLGMDSNLVQEEFQSRNAEYDGPSVKTDRRRPVTESGTSGSNVNHVEKKGSADIRKGVKDVKLRRNSKTIVQYSTDDDLIQERAAFKSLEESDDAYDTPRVSRVDMEERIQRLAKCLNGADIDMPEWIFSKMIRSAKIRFSDHSVLRLIQILGKFGNWRRVLQVVEWFQLRERFKSHKIRYVYTAALDALGKARRPTEALNVFNAMQQQLSSYPDLVAYRCIAVTLGQAGHMKELFDVIDSMRSPPKKKFMTGVLQKWDPRLEPDIIVYNAVLNACVRRKNWEGAFWVLEQLKQQGQEPSGTTYGLVMEVMFACGKYNLVHEFFRKVQKSSIPNALTYKVLVNTLWRQGNIDDAVLAVQDMERRGIIGSAGLYYDLARCLCSAGRSQEAITQIDKICKVANKPLVVTYTGLIQACLDSGNIQSGIYIFNHMLKFCPPNLVTYNIMLKGYLDYEMFEEAKQLFQKLLENSNHVRSNQDYRERVIPDIYTFNLMLDACAGKNQWDDLESVYKRMLQHGYHFNPKRHLRIIMDACRTGKVELLEITWKHFVQKDQLPPPLLIKEMFRLKLEQDDFAAAFSCISSLPSSESHKFSRKSWSSFFRENAHIFRKDTLVRLVEEVSTIISRSDSPKLMFQNLLASCKELLRTQMTVAEVDQTESASRVKYEAALVS